MTRQQLEWPGSRRVQENMYNNNYKYNIPAETRMARFLMDTIKHEWQVQKNV